jgi:hypothetical protein
MVPKMGKEENNPFQYNFNLTQTIRYQGESQNASAQLKIYTSNFAKKL